MKRCDSCELLSDSVLYLAVVPCLRGGQHHHCQDGQEELVRNCLEALNVVTEMVNKTPEMDDKRHLIQVMHKSQHRKSKSDDEENEKLTYPPYLIMYALLLRVPCRAIRIQFPCREVLVQEVEIRIALSYTRIDWREHPICSICVQK